MTGLNKPIYGIAFKDEWLTGTDEEGRRFIQCYGTKKEADSMIKMLSEKNQAPKKDYRRVEFKHDGIVAKG